MQEAVPRSSESNNDSKSDMLPYKVDVPPWSGGQPLSIPIRKIQVGKTFKDILMRPLSEKYIIQNLYIKKITPIYLLFPPPARESVSGSQ
jgi:hypothetical protein